jgi:anti-anti-sigma factor
MTSREKSGRFETALFTLRQRGSPKYFYLQIINGKSTMVQSADNSDEVFFEVAAQSAIPLTAKNAPENRKKPAPKQPDVADIPIDQPVTDESVESHTLFDIINHSQRIMPEKPDTGEKEVPYQPVWKTLPFSNENIPEKQVPTEKPAAPPLGPLHSVGNSVKKVVQLKTEAKSEAFFQREGTIGSMQNIRGGHTMHALKNEPAEAGTRDPAVSIVKVAPSETTETPKAPIESPDLSINNSADQPYSGMAQHPSPTPVSPDGKADGPSLAVNEQGKRETKSRFVPSITMPDFQATVLEGETSPEECIVILTGSIERDQISPLDQFFSRVIQKSTKHLFCDVGGLVSINSSGWGLLSAQMQRLRKRGGDLSLCSMQGEVERSFKVLDLNKLFLTFRTVSEAMRKITAEPGNLRPFPKIKPLTEEAPQARPSLSLEEKIHRIVGQDPSLGAGDIRKLLDSESYGNTKIGLLKLMSKLRSMNLGSKEERYRFFRSS